MEERKGNTIKNFLRSYSFVIFLVVLYAVFSIIIPPFSSYANIMDFLRAASITALIGLGFTMCLIVSEYNLSLSAVAGLVGMLVTGFMVWTELSAGLSIVLVLLIGLCIGGLTALFILKLKIPSLLATLGFLFLLQGIELTYSGGQSIHSHMYLSTAEGYSVAPGAISDGFNFIGQGYLFSIIPFPVIIMLVVGVVLAIMLHYTKLGRFLYATGSNQEGARLCGIKTGFIVFLAFLLSGGLAALGGIVLSARLGMGQVLAGQAFFLPAVAAAFIGTTVGPAKKPNPMGTLVGAITIAVILNGLTMLNVPYTTQDIFIGAILLVALILSNSSKNSR